MWNTMRLIGTRLLLINIILHIMATIIITNMQIEPTVLIDLDKTLYNLHSMDSISAQYPAHCDKCTIMPSDVIM